MNNPLPWGRWYADHLDNPDYLLLNDTARVVFNELFCLCLKDGGEGAIRLSTIPLRLRRHPNQIKVAILALTGVGWVEDLGGDLLGLPGWSLRQRRGDHSGGSRVAKFRENKQLRDAGNVTGNAAVTPSETEGETETEAEGTIAHICLVDDVPPTATARVARPWSRGTMTRDQALAVFRYWERLFEKEGNGNLFEGKREDAIRARANEGVSVAEAIQAVLGCYSMGKRDTFPDGRKRILHENAIKFTLIFRNDEQMRGFIDTAKVALNKRKISVSEDGTCLVDADGNVVDRW